MEHIKNELLIGIDRFNPVLALADALVNLQCSLITTVLEIDDAAIFINVKALPSESNRQLNRQNNDKAQIIINKKSGPERAPIF